MTSRRATPLRIGLVGGLCLAALVASLQVQALPSEVDTADEGPSGEAVDGGAIPLALQAVALEVAARPLGERIAAISRELVGAPYLVDATGEGVLPDLDPPARYDAFDCLTFVEEVLALALAADPIGAGTVRSALRYGDAAVSYEQRRHFMLAEWVPGNVADGWLVDITDTLGETHLLEKGVTPETWRWWRRRSLFSLPDARLPAGQYQLPLLSIDAAMEAADRIPDGAILLTVRRDNPGVPIVVTHLGFKLDGGDQPVLRHATRMRGKQVMDHKLSWYLDHLRWYHRWPVEGIHVLMPQEQGPRVSRLPTPARTLAATRD